MTRGLDISRLASSFRIRTRIYAAFAALGLLILVAGAIGQAGLLDARRNSHRSQVVNQRLVSVLELDRAVVDLQRSVQVFSYTGHASVASTARTKLESLETHIKHVGELLDSQAEVDLLDRIREHLASYDATFERAVAERQTRYALVHDALPALDQRLTAALAASPRHTHLTTEQHRALSDALAFARAGIYKYLNDPDYELVERARARLLKAADLVRASSPTMAIDLASYAATASAIVHSTRGYLYLVGVVMAATANELVYVSDLLKDSAIAEAHAILDGIDESARSAFLRAVVGGLIVLLVGMVAVVILASSISTPIQEITETFERLGRGEHVGEIPGRDRTDEIGVMATAASAFRSANERTATLLDAQRELTAELETSQAELQRSNEELEQFVYTVSHDLKSPIVTSLGFIGMMRSLADRGQAETALAKLPVLERANRRMSQLTTDLLELSRVGRVDNESTNVETSLVVAEVLETLDKSIRDVDAEIDVQAGLPMVWSNTSRLMQVLENLIGNALKYGAQPGESPRISIGGKVADDGSTVLYVHDEGPGIDPEYHDRVFGLFQRLDNKRQGTGVGLSIVARVMKSHGGHVTIDSDGRGHGCTFKLEFPRPDESQEKVA